MNHEEKNPLLREYLNQIEDNLEFNEKKQYESYSFYDVYEVSIGGYSSAPGCCEACVGCGFLICLCNICMYS